MRERIYYADGSVFDGDPLGIGKAPRYGVLAVLHDGVIEHGFDWYLIERAVGAFGHEEGRRWVGVKGDASLILKFLHRAGVIVAVFAGESVPNEAFQPVLSRAVEDQAHD